MILIFRTRKKPAFFGKAPYGRASTSSVYLGLRLSSQACASVCAHVCLCARMRVCVYVYGTSCGDQLNPRWVQAAPKKHKASLAIYLFDAGSSEIGGFSRLKTSTSWTQERLQGRTTEERMAVRSGIKLRSSGLPSCTIPATGTTQDTRKGVKKQHSEATMCTAVDKNLSAYVYYRHMHLRVCMILCMYIYICMYMYPYV